MKTYTKVHQLKHAADNHLANIKKRGGIATPQNVKGGIKISYHFPEKPVRKKKTLSKKK